MAMEIDSSRQPDSLENPERFRVVYLIEAKSPDEAKKLAWDLCLEQTVELPGQTKVVKEVEPYVVGSIEKVEVVRANAVYRVTVAFPNDTAGDELTQFINVLFGNSCLKPGLEVEDVILSEKLAQNKKMFPGPRFGTKGLRSLVGVPEAPLLCTALKPMGKSSKELAEMAYQLARGGIDIIKDDHGLADQVWAPYEERVTLCAQAVNKANAETGKKCLYAPCINAPANKVVERSLFAKKAGAGAVLALPGITGFDVVRELAANDDFALPILVHPAMLGGWLTGSENSSPSGMSHKFLFGTFPRLCGGDSVIFPNSGGRFQFSHTECQEIAEGCRESLGRFEPILPSPAGGMKLNRVEEMRQKFGDDTLYLIGGALLNEGTSLEEAAKKFSANAGRDKPYAKVSLNGDAKLSAASDYADVKRVCRAVRRRVLEYAIRNNGGYLSQACSSVEALATLYLRGMKLGPSVADGIPGPFRGSPGPGIPAITGEGHNGDPTDPALDRLIFSPVHYACVLYALLVEVGRLDVAAFNSFNKDGSTVELIGAEHSPGHAVTAGSLAQALSQAAGIAYARKLKEHTGRVVVYMSDGEFQEGQTWEAVQGMVFHNIGNVTAVVDVNGQQCDGKMSSVMEVGSITKKLEAFGAEVYEVDGHDIAAIERATKANAHPNKPKFVVCITDPCRGFELLREKAPRLHYLRFRSVEEKSKWEKVLSDMEAEDEANGVVMATAENQADEQPAKRRKVESTLADQAVTAHRRKVEAVLTTENSTVTACKAEHIETTMRPHRTNLIPWVKKHPKAIILTADLTSSCEADLCRDEIPGQYLSLGMAEQNMMSFAGGLAREGFRPYIHTFGVFLTRRPFDQVAMSIGVPNLPVRLVGFLPGITTPGGVTHQAIDDVALMRAIPNMRVLDTADATEVESVFDVAESIDGPVYIRMLRGEIPRLFPKNEPMQLNGIRLLSEGQDLTVVTAGICTEEVLKANKAFKEAGVEIKHLHLSTLVPFPASAIVAAAENSKFGIITMENHSIVGGIGSSVAEALADSGTLAQGKKLVRLGVPGVYGHGASRPYLLHEYGLDAHALVEAAGNLVGKKISLEEAKKEEPQTGETKDEDLNARPEDL